MASLGGSHRFSVSFHSSGMTVGTGLCPENKSVLSRRAASSWNTACRKHCSAAECLLSLNRSVRFQGFSLPVCFECLLYLEQICMLSGKFPACVRCLVMVRRKPDMDIALQFRSAPCLHPSGGAGTVSGMCSSDRPARTGQSSTSLNACGR